MKKLFFRLIGISLIVTVLVSFRWLKTPPDPCIDGKRLTVWLELYRASDRPAASDHQKQVAAKACQAISSVGTNAIPTLMALIQAKDPPAKKKLLWLASKQHAFPIRIKRAEDKNMEAVGGFRVLGEASRPAIPSLTAAFERKISPEAQWACACALADLGRAATSAVPVLLRGLKDASPGVRRSAVYALGKVHPQPAELLEILAGMLDDPNFAVSSTALRTLGDLESDPKPAVPKILRIAADPASPLLLRREAIRFLGKFQACPEQAVPMLVSCLSDPDRKIRSVAAAAIGHFTNAPVEAREALTTALQDPDKIVRESATEALKQLHQSSRTASQQSTNE